MLHHEFHPETGILILSPEGPLERSDFEAVARSVDGYIAQKGQLKGLMIFARAFPGWKDFAAFITHLRFVGGHEKRIARVAVVSDSPALTLMPEIASHFLHPDLQHFPLNQTEAAMQWLSK
jgi:hypothetical protein